MLRALILRKAALLRTAVAVCQATAHVLHATPPVVEHKRPNQAPRTDYKSSVWWRALQHPNVSNPTTKEGRKFRLRFRVPFPIFQRLLALSREWFPQRDTDVSGRPSVPIELKLLCVLRVLGRGVCFDDCEEITGADEETLRVWFHAAEMYPIFMSSLLSQQQPSQQPSDSTRLWACQEPSLLRIARTHSGTCVLHVSPSFGRNLNFLQLFLWMRCCVVQPNSLHTRGLKASLPECFK